MCYVFVASFFIRNCVPAACILRRKFSCTKPRSFDLNSVPPLSILSSCPRNRCLLLDPGADVDCSNRSGVFVPPAFVSGLRYVHRLGAPHFVHNFRLRFGVRTRGARNSLFTFIFILLCSCGVYMYVLDKVRSLSK